MFQLATDCDAQAWSSIRIALSSAHLMYASVVTGSATPAFEVHGGIAPKVIGS